MSTRVNDADIFNDTVDFEHEKILLPVSPDLVGVFDDVLDLAFCEVITPELVFTMLPVLFIWFDLPVDTLWIIVPEEVSSSEDRPTLRRRRRVRRRRRGNSRDREGSRVSGPSAPDTTAGRVGSGTPRDRRLLLFGRHYSL